MIRAWDTPSAVVRQPKRRCIEQALPRIGGHPSLADPRQSVGEGWYLLTDRPGDFVLRARPNAIEVAFNRLLGEAIQLNELGCRQMRQHAIELSYPRTAPIAPFMGIFNDHGFWSIAVNKRLDRFETADITVLLFYFPHTPVIGTFRTLKQYKSKASTEWINRQDGVFLVSATHAALANLVFRTALAKARLNSSRLRIPEGLVVFFSASSIRYMFRMTSSSAMV